METGSVVEVALQDQLSCDSCHIIVLHLTEVHPDLISFLNDVKAVMHKGTSDFLDSRRHGFCGIIIACAVIHHEFMELNNCSSPTRRGKTDLSNRLWKLKSSSVVSTCNVELKYCCTLTHKI